MPEQNIDTQLLARLLGETFRVQKQLEMAVSVDDGTIYGLIHGVEAALDSIRGDRWISNERFSKAEKVLSSVFDDREKLAKFKGFYDLERDWQNAGLDRTDAIILLTYFYNSGKFVDLINKMNSKYSPIECKTFELDEYDK